MPHIFSLLSYGLLLGFKHSLEADHVIAVSTILAEEKNTKKAALIGTLWGLGHTTTLCLIGALVLFFRISIPEYVAERLELLVGIMLIILGIQSLFKKPSIPQHEHSHSHGAIHHTHLHQGHTHKHGRSFIVGAIHGLAGSGALMLLVLSLVQSMWEGIFYILLFGLGSTLSMTGMSLLISIPFTASIRSFSNTERYIRLITGSVSILFGFLIIKDILFA